MNTAKSYQICALAARLSEDEANQERIRQAFLASIENEEPMFIPLPHSRPLDESILKKFQDGVKKLFGAYQAEVVHVEIVEVRHPDHPNLTVTCLKFTPIFELHS